MGQREYKHQKRGKRHRKPSDEGCTMESVSEVNTQFLELAQKYPINFVLIDELKSSGRLLRQPSSDYSLAKVFGCTLTVQ